MDIPKLHAVFAFMACGLLAIGAAGCDPSPEPASGPATAEALHGTGWYLDDFFVMFEAPDKVKLMTIRVDVVTTVGGTYTVKDGIIEVTVLQQIRAGTWDGSRLVIDGMVGIREDTRITENSDR